jgi:tetratricopeptide (TPR) repeat protein
MDGWDNPKSDVLRLVRSWLCDESNGQWVMIIDNADDSSVFFPLPVATQVAVVEPLSDFLPQSPNGSIVFTSRSGDLARRLTGRGDCLVEVKPMDKDDALALLQKKLGYGVDKDDAIELIHLLDSMPLAITQAAAYIEQRAPRMTISRYLDKVRQSDQGQSSLLMKDVGDGRRDGRASNSIIATWQISFTHIQKEMPTAADLLSLMSLFDGQSIPESLLHFHYWRDDDVEADIEDDIYALTNYSLIKMSADGKQFQMHRLVQFSMKRWLELYDELGFWKETYVTLMDDNYSVGRHENWATCQKLFPHVQAAIECQPDMKRLPDNANAVEVWASVLHKGAWYALEMGKYKEAEDMNRRALEGRERALGKEHPTTLKSVGNLAVTLQFQGKYEESEDVSRRAFEGCEKVLGKEHPNTLGCMDNLAVALQSHGKYEQAEDMSQRALRGYEKVLGKEHPDTIGSVANLAAMLGLLGKYDQAEDMNQRAVEGYEKALGKEHPDTLMSMDNLAIVLRFQGKYDQAENMHQRALRGYEKVLGKEHPITLGSITNLAIVLRFQGKYNQAEDMNQRAVDGYEKVLGREHPDTLMSMDNLGVVLRFQGKYDQAENMHQRALRGYEKVLGKEHPITLGIITNLGVVLRFQRKYDQAENMLQRALEGYEKVLGNEHPDTLMSMDNLAVVLRFQGKYDQAENMNQQALEGYEKVLGKEHPDTLNSVYNLACLLHQRQQYEDASLLYHRAWSGFKEKLGPDHPTTRACLEDYTLLQQLQGLPGS